MSRSIAYRPGIDGLRALAVLSVFVFHLDHDWLPGGFVGVDVFFVLSGFLISSIILSECRKGSFSLLNFYQRRIARIFPLFSLVALATIVGAWFVYSEQDLASAGANLVAAALSLANMKYMTQSNYFEISVDAQPYLHYWSLSVEEQFYMAYPLGLFLLMRFIKSERVVAWVLGLAAIASLGLCVGVTMWRPTWAFYLLPTRGWELLAGGLLAMWVNPKASATAGDAARADAGVDTPPTPAEGARRDLGPILAWVGLVMILASFVVVHGGDHFPGIVAALPVVGTCLVILNRADSRVERLLATGPMVLVGKLSYSLYLWHWPVFSLVDYAMYLEPMWVRLAIKVVLSAGLSVGTYMLIEGPARRWLTERSRRGWAYGFLVLSLLVLVPVGYMTRMRNFLDVEKDTVASGGLQFMPTRQEGPHIVLMGDSHALMYATAVRDMAREMDSRLNVLAVANDNPIPDPPDAPPATWTDSLAALDELKPDVVVYVMGWGFKAGHDTDLVREAVEAIRSRAELVILVTQPPALPPGAGREWVRDGRPLPFIEPEEIRRARLLANDAVRAMEGPGVVVIDIESMFGRGDGAVIHELPGGPFVYHDDDHLSGRGARLVTPLIRQVIER